MPTLHLLRHGTLLPNPERRFVGQRNIPLSEEGRRQARFRRQELFPVPLQEVWMSDLVRCREMTAIITFVLFEAAYFAEIMRAGIQSVGRGQLLAAAGLGMTYLQTMRYVVLPQAVRHMLPVLLTQVIILFQDTSLVYVISGNDFMGAVSKIAQRDGQLILMYSFAAVCYLSVSFSLSMLVRRMQAKLSAAR